MEELVGLLNFLAVESFSCLFAAVQESLIALQKSLSFLQG